MANYLTETLEGPGWVDADWTEDAGSGSTITDDDAGPGSLPTNGGSYCLETTSTTGNKAQVYNTLAAEYAITYTRFYLYIPSSGPSGWEGIGWWADSSSGMVCQIIIDSTDIKFEIYNNGGTQTIYGLTAYDADAWTCWELKYDNTNTAYELWKNGVSVADGSLTGTIRNGMKVLYFGQLDWNSQNFSMWFDNFKIGDSYIGPESAAGAPTSVLQGPLVGPLGGPI